MDNPELRTRLMGLATVAIPVADAVPLEVVQRGIRGQRRSAITAVALAISVLAGGFYGVSMTRDLVGPAPMADSNGQVADPPNRASSAGFGLSPMVVDGRICASFSLEYSDAGEESRSAAQLCDTDPNAQMSVETRFLEVDSEMEPSGLVLVAAAVDPEVTRIEIDLPGRLNPMQEMGLLELNEHPRKIGGSALGRELFLDKKGDFVAIIRAFDAAGDVLIEQPLCDPLGDSNTC